jgi:hypothetical protein
VNTERPTVTPTYMPGLFHGYLICACDCCGTIATRDGDLGFWCDDCWKHVQENYWLGWIPPCPIRQAREASVPYPWEAA